MRKKSIIQILSLFLFGCLTMGMLVGCTKEEKEIVISDDIREDIKAEEDEVEVLKSKANEYLEQSNFKEAKSLYEKAILMDKGNKDLYIEIKDEYINYNRLDDAYNIVKTAIDNKIDVDNMMKIADSIKSQFDKVEYADSIVQGENYQLPAEGVISVNGEEITVPIYWNDAEVNTSSTGDFVYEGINEQYGRSFSVNLNVKYKNLTEAEVRSMSLAAKTAIDSIILCQNLSPDNIIYENEMTFSTSYKYKTSQEIINALSPYCTNDAIYSFLDKHVIERDGEVYITYGDVGICVGISVESDAVAIEQTETTLKAIYSKGYGDGIATQTYNFIKYNNSWFLTNVFIYQ